METTPQMKLKELTLTPPIRLTLPISSKELQVSWAMEKANRRKHNEIHKSSSTELRRTPSMYIEGVEGNSSDVH
jgi:hypothetical protein